MSKILILGEQKNQKTKSSTLELISGFSQAGHEVSLVLTGDSGLAACAEEAGKFGAKTVYTYEQPEFKNFLGEAYALAAIDAAKKASPDLIVSTHSPSGKDFMPRVAYRLGVGYIADCNQVDAQNLKFKKPVYSGKAIASVEFKKPGMNAVSIRPNTFPSAKENPSSPQVQSGSVDLSSCKTKITEVVSGQAGRPDVTEASIVISGGRSLKSAENFKLLEDLADLLGAGVGASRAAVDAGYRPHRDQVGQTGKVVSPSLYIACGISGAIQHLAGMRSSKTIVAINTDPQAPIFQIADYGIVADLFEFVPLFAAECRKIKE